MSSFWRTNKKGFSLIEVMISIGVLMFVLFVFVAVLETFQRKNSSAEGQVQYRMDLSLIERVVFSDLNWSFPSIGNLNLRGTDNREFFQYYGGVPVGRIPAAARTRELILTPTNNRVLEFITEDPKAGDRRYFQPAQAYTFTLNLFTISPLTYASVNQARFFTDSYPAHWGAGGHFVFYAPAPLKDLISGGANPPVRFYSTLGYASGADVSVDTLGGNLKTAHPHLRENVASMDGFLRLIPTLGGAMSQLVVVPVQVIRYRLLPDPQSGTGRLMRSVRNGLNYGNEVFLGGGIERIVFSRPDVTARRIEFHVQLKRSQ